MHPTWTARSNRVTALWDTLGFDPSARRAFGRSRSADFSPHPAPDRLDHPMDGHAHGHFSELGLLKCSASGPRPRHGLDREIATHGRDREGGCHFHLHTLS